MDLSDCTLTLSHGSMKTIWSTFKGGNCFLWWTTLSLFEKFYSSFHRKCDISFSSFWPCVISWIHEIVDMHPLEEKGTESWEMGKGEANLGKWSDKLPVTFEQIDWDLFQLRHCEKSATNEQWKRINLLIGWRQWDWLTETSRFKVVWVISDNGHFYSCKIWCFLTIYEKSPSIASFFFLFSSPILPNYFQR